MLVRKNHRRQSYVFQSKELMAAENNDKIVRSIDSLMQEEKTRTQLAFDKIVPFVNEIFCSLANYDIRFEFGSLPLESGDFEKVVENEYNVLCPLKELPKDYLRLEGKESTGLWSVRLSRDYEDSIDKVSWMDISLAPDSKGCRYFSTARLLRVLMAGLKHAINDVIPSEEEESTKDKFVRCREKNNMIYLDVKVSDCSLRLNLLPCVPFTRDIMKSLTMDARISRTTKQMNLETMECAYLVAKPLPTQSEKLWRVTVNNIENSLVRKIFDLTECGSHCVFALNLISEQLFAEEKNKGVVPYYLTRMAFLNEFLKYPDVKSWKFGYFTVRMNSILRSLENHLCKGELKNILSGINIVSHRKKDNLEDLSNDVARLRSKFQGYFG